MKKNQNISEDRKKYLRKIKIRKIEILVTQILIIIIDFSLLLVANYSSRNESLFKNV